MKLNYTVTKELMEALIRISSMEEKLKNASLPSSLRTTLLQETKIHSSHFSSRIEGNCLTLSQTETVFKGKDLQAPKRDIQEVQNLFEVFDFILEQAKQKQKTTLKLILKIHQLVQKNIVKWKLLGHLREAQNAIYNSATGGVIYMPPEAKDLPELMGQFIDLLNHREWEHPLIGTAVAHFGIAAIHPFMDGNGRTARVLSTWMLLQEGFQFIQYSSLDEFFWQHRPQYYHVLHEAQGEHYYLNEEAWQIQDWLAFFISGAEQMIQGLLQHIETAPVVMPLNQRQEKGLQYLKRRKTITNREYRELNKTSNFTALTDLNVLEERGLIKRIGQGRSVQYILTSPK